MTAEDARTLELADPGPISFGTELAQQRGHVLVRALPSTPRLSPVLTALYAADDGQDDVVFLVGRSAHLFM